MKIYLSLAILISVTITSCKIGTNNSISNSGIPIEIRNQIEILDGKLLNAIVNNDLNGLKQLMSYKLLNLEGLDVESVLKQASTQFQINEFQIIDRYYIQNSTEGLGNTVFSSVEDEDRYQISITSMNKESIISLILPFGGKSKFFILNVYGKYADAWKLNIIQFGLYEINGKNAPELYKQAKNEYKKEYLVDATNSMFLNSKVLKPSKAFEYEKEDEMRMFLEKLIDETKSKYEFPIVINEIETAPRILSIFPQETDEGFFPMVQYLTSINFSDTVRLKFENEKLRYEAVKLFPGLDIDKDYIFYKAYSHIPDVNNPANTYGFIQKLK